MATNDTRTNVTLPASGSVNTYRIASDSIVTFDFDTSEAVFIGKGNDLTISVGDQTVILEGYLPLAKQEALPVFELLGGEQVPGEVYLFAFNEENDNEDDLETAAGRSALGGGAGDYEDDSGDMYDGVGASEGQDDPSFSNTRADLASGQTGPQFASSTAAANTAPVAAADSFSTDEDTAINFNLLANDSDPDGNPISLSGIPTAENGSVAVNPDGTITYTPNANFNGTDTITYTISDGQGGTSTTTATVTVNPVNDAPVAADDTVTTDEDTPVTLDVLANDTDVDGDTLSVSGTPTAANGSVAVNADGTITYTPNANFNGTDTITYTVSDGQGGTDTATVNVTVNAVNDAPVAVADSFATDEDTNGVFDLLANDTDVDGDQLSIVTDAGSEPSAQNGTVAVNADGTVTYTPNANFNGTDTITYTVKDPSGATSTTTATITVNPVNDLPELTVSGVDQSTNFIQNGSFETYNNGQDIVVDQDGSDAAGTGWAGGNVQPDGWDMVSGSRWEVMGGNRHGIEGATDGDNVLDFGVGSQPLVISQTVTGLSEGQYLLQMDLFDRGSNRGEADSGDIIVKWNGQEVARFNPGDVDWETGSVIITVPEGQTQGTLVLESTNGDSYGNVVDNVRMYAVSDSDSSNFSILETAAGGTYVATAAGTDVETAAADLRYSLVGDSPFTIDPVTGVISLDAGSSLNYEDVQSYTITVRVTDADGGATTKDVTINVTDVNEAPVTADVTLADVAEDSGAHIITSAQLLGTASDPDGDSLSITNLQLSEGQGTLTDNGDGTWTFTPDENWNGSVEFSYEVSDGELSTPQTAGFEVTPVNDAPELDFSFAGAGGTNLIENGSFETYNNGQDIVVNQDGSDDLGTGWAGGNVQPDGWEKVSGSRWEVMGGNRSGIDGATDGDNVLDFGVGNALAISQTVTGLSEGQYLLQMDLFDRSSELGGNDGGSIDVYWNDELVASFNPGDTEWETGNVVIDVAPGETQGELVLVSHDADSYGNVIDNVRMQAISGNDTNTVSIDETAAGGSYVASAMGSDIDSMDLSFSIVNNTSPFTIDPDTGVISLRDGASLDYESGNTSYTITVQVADGDGGIATKDLTINVNDVNEAPVTSPDVLTVREDGAANVNVLRNDVDPEDDELSIEGVPTAEHGTVTVNANGTLRYEPNDNYNGPDTIIYQVTDGNGNVSTGTVDVTVTPRNDRPDAGRDYGEAVEDGASASGNVLANDSDIDGDVLSVSRVNGDENSVGTEIAGRFGSITINADGSYTYTADNTNDRVQGLGVGQSVSENFQYQVSDGQGGYRNQTLTITINGTNDAPVATEDTRGAYEDQADVSGRLLSNDSDIDGDALVVSEVNGSQTAVGTAVAGTYGTITIGADGRYTYSVNDSMADIQKLGVGDSVTETFTYTVSDGQGGTDTATLTITVHGTNDRPDTVADTNAIDEDASAPVSGNVLFNDSDTDTTDVLTVHRVNGDTDKVGESFDGRYGSIKLNADGSYEYTVDNANARVQGLGVGQSVTETFSYQVTDGEGGYRTETLSITINGTNDAPVATDDVRTAYEDRADVSGRLLSNDSDIDGDALVVSEVNGSENAVGTAVAGTYGSITIGADGRYTYSVNDSMADIQKLGVGDSVTETFTYTVSDGQGGTDTATVTITVQGTNDRPVAVADTNAIDEDASAPVSGNVLANDSDTDATDVLEVSRVNGDPDKVGESFDGRYGTLKLNADGSYEYSVNNANGVVQALGVGQSVTETFSYQVTDGQGGYRTESLRITINGENDAPTATADTADITEGTGSIWGNVRRNDSDVDGDSTTVTEVNGSEASVGTAVAGTYGTMTINANGGYRYRLDNTNDAVQGLAEGETATETFTYTLSDGQGGESTATVTITITGTNDGPVAVDDSLVAYEDTPVILDVLANDTDIDGDTLSIDGNPTAVHGSVVVNADGTITYTPDAEYSGTDTITYTVSDGHGGTDTAQVNVTVNAVNDAPVINDDLDLTMAEDGTITITEAQVLALASDVEGDELSVESLTASTGNLTDNGDGTWTFTPNENYNGTVDLGFSVSDGTDTTPGTGTITVTPVNDAPTLDLGGGASDSHQEISFELETAGYNNVFGIYQVDENGVASDPQILINNQNAGISQGHVLGSLPEGSHYEYFIIADGASKHPDLQDSQLSFDTDGGKLVLLIDGQASSKHVYFSEDKHNPDKLDGSDPNHTAKDGTPAPGHFIIEENADGSTTIRVEDLWNGGDRDYRDVVIKLTPAAGSEGEGYDATFIEDAGQVSIASASIEIADVDSDAMSSAEIVLSNTLAGDELRVGHLPEGIIATESTDSTGNIVITLSVAGGGAAPVADFEAAIKAISYYNTSERPDTSDRIIEVTVTDDLGADSNTAETTIRVIEVNDRPDARNDSVSVDEDSSVKIDVLANDTDADGDSISVIGTPTAKHGTVVVNGDGTLTYTPNENYNGSDTISYTVSDGRGGADTAKVNVTVNAVNDGPVAGADTATTDEDTPVTINVLVNDTDVDGDTLSIVTDAAKAPSALHGSVTVNADGTLTYTPVANYNGSDTITYTVSDGKGGESTATVSVGVTPVNDAPSSENFSASAAEAGTPIDIDLAGKSSDVDGEVTDLVITDLPEGGTLYYTDAGGNRVAVTESDLYNEADGSGTHFAADGSFSFESNTAGTTALLGTKTIGDQNPSNWGGDNTPSASWVKTLDNGVTVTTSTNNGVLRQYEQEDSGHMGIGIGDSTGDGINAGDVITVTFEGGVVSTARIGFDGLGGHFDHDSPQQAKAIWVAKLNGVEVARGEVVNTEANDTLFEEILLTQDDLGGQMFDSIEFTTESDHGSNWELRYVEAEFGTDTSLSYRPVDNDGLVGNESTVDIAIISDKLTNTAPESEDFTEVVDGITPIEFDNFVSDAEDDAENAETLVVIKSLPTEGHLVDGDGNIITQAGGIYEMDGISYVPGDGSGAPSVSGAFIGTTLMGNEDISNWGEMVDANTRLLQVSDDVAIRVSSEGGALEQYSQNDPGHIGVGLGIAGKNGIQSGDTIALDFEGAKVSHAEVSFDGMGGHFVADANGNSIAAATWIAYDGDTVVASGDVTNPDPNSLEYVLTIGQDDLNGQLFDRIEFSTDSDQGSNWELKYVNAEFGHGDSFNYFPVDSDGAEGNISTVSLTLDAPDSLSNLAPSIDLDATGQNYTIEAADSDSWGYNLLGMYVLDEDGNPVATEVLYDYSNVNGPRDLDPGDLLVHLEDGQTPQFFVLNSEEVRNGPAFRDDVEITFSKDDKGQWWGTGVNENGDPQTFKAFFDDEALNRFGEQFRIDATDADGTQHWSFEEFIRNAQDKVVHSKDWDDVRFTVTPVDDDASGFTATYDGDPVSIAGNLTIGDEDSGVLSKAVITLTNAQDGDVLNTDGLPGDLFAEVDESVDGQITITLTGQATPAEYAEAIKAITFETTSGDDTPREVTVQVTDSEGRQSLPSNTATATINVETGDPGMVDLDVTGQQVHFVSENAGYNNMLGIYRLDANGEPVEPEIILPSSHDADMVASLLKTFGADEDVRFFLIPDGGDMNIDFSQQLHFIPKGDTWELSVGEMSSSRYVDVKFDDPNLNPASEEPGFQFPQGEDAGVTVHVDESVLVKVDDQFLNTPPDGRDDDDFNDLIIDVRGSEHGLFRGGEGDDVAYGNEGNDTLEGGAGDDLLVGGTGNDLLVGGAGDDQLFGGQGDDVIVTGHGNDLVHTGEGNDVIRIDPSVLADGNSVTVQDYSVGNDSLELGEGMKINEVLYDEDNSITRLLISDEQGGHDVVVDLLGVNRTDLTDFQSNVDHNGAQVDDLIQYLIDSGSDQQ